MRRRLAVLLSTAALGCTPAKPAAPALSVVEANTQAAGFWTQYILAAQNEDVPALVALFTDDIVIVYTGVANVRGKAAAEAMVRQEFADNAIHQLHISSEEVQVLGGKLFQVASYHEVLDHLGKPAQAFGRFSVLLSKGPQGQWQLERMVAVADSMVER
jgi:ketosteroid isomerase-like protein